jgi:hypothetical protein
MTDIRYRSWISSIQKFVYFKVEKYLEVVGNIYENKDVTYV